MGISQYPPIIGIAGHRGSGKDTAGKLINQVAANPRSMAGYNPMRFSGMLKQFAAIWLGIAVAELDKQEVKASYIESLGMTVGELLQRMGGGLREVVHEDFWVIGTMNGLRPGWHYVCTDVRYPNEVAAIEKAGGYVFRLDGDPLGQRGDGTRDDTHSSEVALDGVALPTIKNKSTLGSLRAKVTDLLRHLKAGARPAAGAKILAFK